MQIYQSDGYLRDADGDVVVRFANWETGDHTVPEAVESVDYVSGPAAHDEPVAEKYLPDRR
jgi:hypothetical protein